MSSLKLFVSSLLLLAAQVIAAGGDSVYKLPDYSYHKLPNGFELILVENHTNPLIASIVVVRTGLCNESPVNNGVSHMLEHLTFNGTSRRTQKQLYDELDYNGIYLNAQTSEDYTAFMALYHREQNSRSLDILSDMLFHSTFPDTKFDKEKGIIVEEIGKDSENPIFKQETVVRAAFYPEPPYNLPVIGTVESVKNMTREQVINYYHKYYRPNNMISIIIGDFDKAEMLKEVRNYFGNVKAEPIEKKAYPLKCEFPFLFSTENRGEQTVYINLPAPTFASDAYVPFQFFNALALEGASSPVATTLKKDPDLHISRVEPSYEFHPDFAVLTLKITTATGVDPAAVRKAALEALRDFSKKTVNSEEVEALKKQIAISEILQTEKILYYGFLKAQELSVAGIDAFTRKVPSLLDADLAGIQSFIEEYPAQWSAPERLFAAGSWTVREISAEYKTDGDAAQKRINRVHRKVFHNGLTVVHLENNDSPVLAMHLLFKNRSGWEDADKHGIADFLHHSLFRSSQNFSEAEMKNRLKEIGAEVKAYDMDFIPYDDYYNVPAYSYVRFTTLDQFHEPAMELLSENILRPDLEAAFADVQKRMKSLSSRTSTSARAVAKQQFLQGLFGEDHPLAQMVSGTPVTISAISLEDLQEFHNRYFTPGNIILSVVSSLDSATVFSRIEKYFGNLQAGGESVRISDLPDSGKSGMDSLKIGSRQAYIYLGYLLQARPDEIMPLRVMNSILSDRIAFSLREEKGWAYRLGTSIGSWRNKQYFFAHMGTGRETTQLAIQGIKDEIEKFKSAEIGSAEVEKAKNSMIAALVRRRASRESQAFNLGLNEFNGSATSAYFDIFDRIKAVTVNQVNALKGKYLRSDNNYLFYTIPTEGKSKSGPMMPGMMRH